MELEPKPNSGHISVVRHTWKRGEHHALRRVLGQNGDRCCQTGLIAKEGEQIEAVFDEQSLKLWVRGIHRYLSTLMDSRNRDTDNRKVHSDGEVNEIIFQPSPFTPCSQKLPFAAMTRLNSIKRVPFLMRTTKPAVIPQIGNYLTQ